MQLPSGRQFARDPLEVVHIELCLAGLQRDGQAGRAPALQPQKRSRCEIRVAIAADRDQSPPWATTRSTMRSRPSPLLRLLNTNGRAPRIFFASRSMTSRLAPTNGAKSILLMTRRSERVMPGPPFLGILSPAATSMT